jgi:hypothetical protein
VVCVVCIRIVCEGASADHDSIILIFSLKAIVLLLYWRIFSERWQIWMLRITSVFSVVAFIAITLALSLVCLPYHQRWQIVPPPPLHCTASPRILITASSVNALTDILVTLTHEDCAILC